MIIFLAFLFFFYFFFFGPALETAGFVKGLSDDDDGCSCSGCLIALLVLFGLLYLLFG